MGEIVKIYLSEEIFNTALGYLNIELYIDETTRKEYPEIHESLDKEFHKVISRVLKSRLGANWEKLIEKDKDHLCYHKYLIRDYYLKELLNFNDHRVGMCKTFHSINRYPFIPDFNNYVTNAELKNLSSILYTIINLRIDLYDRLVKSQVINNNGFLCMRTFEDLKTRCQDLFYWWIDKALVDNNFSEIKIISREDDLNYLKKWVPEVMI